MKKMRRWILLELNKIYRWNIRTPYPISTDSDHDAFKDTLNQFDTFLVLDYANFDYYGVYKILHKGTNLRYLVIDSDSFLKYFTKIN